MCFIRTVPTPPLGSVVALGLRRRHAPKETPRARAELTEQIENVQRVTRQRHELSETERSLIGEIDALRNTVDQLEARNAKSAAVSANEAGSLQRNLDDTTAQLADARAAGESLRARLSEAERDASELRRKVDETSEKAAKQKQMFREQADAIAKRMSHEHRLREEEYSRELATAEGKLKDAHRLVDDELKKNGVLQRELHPHVCRHVHAHLHAPVHAHVYIHACCSTNSLAHIHVIHSEMRMSIHRSTAARARRAA